MKPNPIISSGIALSLALPLAADTIRRTDIFNISQPENAETVYGIGLPAPSTQESTTLRLYRGVIAATFTFDPDTLEFESFSFSNGNPQSEFQIYTEDPPEIPPPVPLPPPMPYLLELLTRLDDPPLGTNGITYVRSQGFPDGSVIRFRPETPNPPGRIKADGSLDNSEHVFFTYAGGTFTQHVVDTVPQQSRIVNYTLDRPELPMTGTFTPQLSIVGSNLWYRQAVAILGVLVDERISIELQGVPQSRSLKIEEFEKGSYTANTAQFNIPKPFERWANDNDTTLLNPEAENASGFAYGILFALDLPTDATSLPIRTAIEGSEAVATLDLPDGGLLNGMSVEYSPDLGATDWSELPDEFYLDGTNSLDLGKTGSPRFGYPDSGRGFIRFVSIVE